MDAETIISYVGGCTWVLTVDLLGVRNSLGELTHVTDFLSGLIHIERHLLGILEN